jgi:hypothetical protein
VQKQVPVFFGIVSRGKGKGKSTWNVNWDILPNNNVLTTSKGQNLLLWKMGRKKGSFLMMPYLMKLSIIVTRIMAV